MTPHEKLNHLEETLASMDGLVVAFSGGVDSAFLLKTAVDALGDRAVAVTAVSPIFPAWESCEANAFAAGLGVRQETLQFDALQIPGFRQNPANRCYICKKELFCRILARAKELGIPVVADGSNADDTRDYRPGMQAIRELGILSPLQTCEMTKADIRTLSREMNLPTWEKPAFACLASRFPYGQEITPENLNRIEQAEQFLLDCGFRQVRVRCHGDVARIEVPAEDRARFIDLDLSQSVSAAFQQLGFSFVALDLLGYRMGSMNETLRKRS